MRKIVNLHILRALATIVVASAHAITRTNQWSELPAIIYVMADVMGAMAVDTFFVISGFIMIFTSSDLFGGRTGVAEFARRRLIRIVPLYWLATATEIALRARHHNAPGLSEVFHTLFFVPQVTHPGEPLRPVVGVGWTLNYEALFYVMFGLALFLPRRIGVPALLAAIAALVAAGGFVKPLTDTSAPTTVVTFLTDRIMLMFALGIVAGLVYERAGEDRRGFIRHPFRLAFALCGGSIAVLFAAGAGTHPPLGWELLLRAAVLLVAMVCLFGAPSPSGAPTRILSHLADASYSIYLFHFIIIVGLEKVWLAVFGAHGPVACVLTLAAAAHAGGLLIHLTIERPTTRLLQSLTRSQPTRDTAPAGVRRVGL
ncbi:acyltransferase family protein [Methylobacterium planeticum]|uniref:Acyltransferase n=1 Tax=Methylobacterium planeticum TaxID=2615211 RepID=A0A6N6MI43_9HYPH|nr:acyltransferase [Methylobacterium planeticum]KAB1069585.1 acyltransferase [Methylobacterium planeticum]